MHAGGCRPRSVADGRSGALVSGGNLTCSKSSAGGGVGGVGGREGAGVWGFVEGAQGRDVGGGLKDKERQTERGWGGGAAPQSDSLGVSLHWSF